MSAVVHHKMLSSVIVGPGYGHEELHVGCLAGFGDGDPVGGRFAGDGGAAVHEVGGVAAVADVCAGLPCLAELVVVSELSDEVMGLPGGPVAGEYRFGAGHRVPDFAVPVYKDFAGVRPEQPACDGVRAVDAGERRAEKIIAGQNVPQRVDKSCGCSAFL